MKYGQHGLPVEIEQTPGFVGVLRPSEPPPLVDPRAAVEQALRRPTSSPSLGAVARGRRDTCVVVSDPTRPVPHDVLLPPLLGGLLDAGLSPASVTLLVATGCHRPPTAEETARLVGKELAGRYRVVAHRARRNTDTVKMGTIDGRVPVLINRLYAQADLKILTGLIEPHMWAGYSGGRKSILPGLSSLRTLGHMHGPNIIADPNTEYGRLQGNPLHEAGLQVMSRAGADFLLNVTLDNSRRMTGIFAGDPVKAHLEGCRVLEKHCRKELDAPLDFAVTTNAGAPFDCNLYQTIKGVTAVAPAVRPGGDIVIASRCEEGVGSADYQRALEMVDTPASFLERLRRGDFFLPDQWCLQETCQVLLEKDIWLFTEGLTPAEVRGCHLHPVTSIEGSIRALLAKHGHHARWAVIPDGPQLILTVRRGN